MRLHLILVLLAILSPLLQCDGNKILCGDALNNALDIICTEGFSRKFRRDVDDRQQTAEQPLLRLWHTMALEQQLDKIEQRQNLEMIKEAAAAQELGRPRRAIAHECCKKGCSYEDLLRYCA